MLQRILRLVFMFLAICFGFMKDHHDEEIAMLLWVIITTLFIWEDKK